MSRQHDEHYPHRFGCLLPTCQDCGMKAPRRPDGVCVICDLLGVVPKLPRGVRGGGRKGRRREAA